MLTVIFVDGNKTYLFSFEKGQHIIAHEKSTLFLGRCHPSKKFVPGIYLL
jgi:hypothetical protein